MDKLKQDIAYFKEECKNEGLIYRQNADINNWDWSRSQSRWRLASEDWQDFREKWYGRADSPLNDADKAQTLSLEYLPEGVTGDATSILVREDYKTIFDYVWVQGLRTRGETGCIITGQPGTGKTHFQFYLLVRLLQMKQVVVFSPNNFEFYLFFGDKVYFAEGSPFGGMFPQPTKSSEDVFLWSLLDTHKIEEPPQSMVSHPCFPVQTASLDERQYKIWDEQTMPLVIGMPSWTEDELRKAFPYQRQYSRLLEKLRTNPSDRLLEFPGVREVINKNICTTTTELQQRKPTTSISLSPEASLNVLLQAAINKFGYAPRNVFDAAGNFHWMTSMHERARNITYDQLRDAILWPTSTNDNTTEVYDWVLAISPVYSGRIFAHVKWEMSFKSEWVAQNMMDKIVAGDTGELYRQYLFFKENAHQSSLAEYFFERFVHRIITETSDATPWHLIPMDSDNFTLFSLPNEASPDDKISLPKIKRKLVKLSSILGFSERLENNAYYVPQERNNRLFSAFTVNFGDSSADLWVIQTTTSLEQEGSREGYRHICYIVKRLKAQLKGKGPRSKVAKRSGKQAGTDVDVRVHYVLAVPAYKFDKHHWRFLKG